MNDNYEPISTSAEKYSFSGEEKKIISQLREWSRTFYSESNLILKEYLTNLADLKVNKYQNVVVKIKEKRCENSTILITIEDEKTENILKIESHINLNNFEYLKQSDICLIRSIKKGYLTY